MSERQQSLLSQEPDPWETDDAAAQTVARVVFPVLPRGEFDYLIPESLAPRVRPGCRLRVPLGRGNRAAQAYCVAVAPVGRRTHPLKSIVDLWDDEPVATAELVELGRWIAEHYLCSWGHVLLGMIPAGVRDRAGTREMRLLVLPNHVRRDLAKLKLTRRQTEVLNHLAASAEPLPAARVMRELRCTASPIQALIAKELLEVVQRRLPIERELPEPLARLEDLALNPDQQSALTAIRVAAASGKHATLLLLGVTGSGKTEVYIRAIQDIVAQGRQAIVLVPEISLTPQTVRRFRERFNDVAVLHSHLSDAERHDHWRRIARGDAQVVVGARSAIFAPLPRLGLIVLDEEHETTFKQESNPRYHAREVAEQRGRQLNIPLVLGSATPSLESYHRALSGEYRLLELPKRVLDRPMPHVGIIDLRNHRLSAKRGAISRPLERAMREALEADGQVILLLNRRGYSTHVQCPACGQAVQCPRCDVSLTFHRPTNYVQCHYCDYRRDAPTECAACRFNGLSYSGLGTQRLEAEVRSVFPEHPCRRMDADSMRGRGSHEEALEAFREGAVKILLGTQMIAKGLDFPNVTLVGVVLADIALHLPDFRAAERTFQLLAQVAGRTGRGPRGGQVLVQTLCPDHPAVQAAATHHFTRFAREELAARTSFGYPPLMKQMRLVFRSRNAERVEQFAKTCGDFLREQLAPLGVAARVMGPAPAPFPKLKEHYRFHLLLHAKDAEPLRRAVSELTDLVRAPDKVEWIVDVDPVSML